MKTIIGILTLYSAFLSVNAQTKAQKDSVLSKIYENDDYSIYKRGPYLEPSGDAVAYDKATKQPVTDKGTLLSMYNTIIAKADSLFDKKNYAEAGGFYYLAFKVNGGQGKVKNRYNAACCYALTGKADNAFLQLDKMVNKGGYYNYYQLSNESKFDSLKTDSRWMAILNKTKTNAEKIKKQLDSKLNNQ